MEFKGIAQMVHLNAVDKGFWEDKPTIDREVALIHGEVSELHEEYRKGHLPNQPYYRADGKVEGINAELADIVIRCMDFAEGYGIDLEQAILEKHKFNTTRPRLHGKKF